MYYKLCLLILAELLLANCEKTSSNETVSSGCEAPFQTVNNGCYLFSDIQLSFNEANDFCENLTPGHIYEISLAMMDYGRDEDQALLDAVAEKGISYWVGAKTEDGQIWTWVDGRDVYSNGPFWSLSEPGTDGNRCAIAQMNIHNLDNINRAYMYDNACVDQMNFICQIGTIKCPPNFVKIGYHCYLQSWAINVPDLNWEESRAYCKSLSVPAGYHADLAVLGLEDQEDYHLMLNLVVGNSGNNNHWIGAYRDSDCHYQWVDGRELPLQSIYWVWDKPQCTKYSHVSLFYWPTEKRALLYDENNNPYPFICQMFKDSQ